MSFGEKLRKLRQEKGLSQWALAKRLGYASNGYIAEIEKGEYIPSEEKLRKIAEALEVPWSKIKGLLLESKIEELGIKRPELIAMFKDIPKLPERDREAIIKAYLLVKERLKKKS